MDAGGVLRGEFDQNAFRFFLFRGKLSYITNDIKTEMPAAMSLKANDVLFIQRVTIIRMKRR